MPALGWRYHAVVLAVCAAVLAAAVLADPHPHAIELFGREVPGLCLFKNVTGMGCPGCGMTRGFAYLGDLDLRSAWAMNPMSPVMFVLVASQLPYRLIRIARQAWAPAA